jgi:glycosyltransferase involved in cell wall biosynthesis
MATKDGPAERKRVLVLASTFPRWQGDTEPPFVHNLCRSLQDGFEITVLAPHALGAMRAERMDGLDIHRFRYMWPERLQKLAYGGILPNLKRNRWLWLQTPSFFLMELIWTLRLIRSHRIDVIHAHWLLPQGLIAAVAGAITRKPVVVTAHGGDVYGLRGRLAATAKRWALRRVTRVTAVSRDLARAIDVLSKNEVTDVDVVSMGVDTEHFRARRDARSLRKQLGIDGPMILFVGRLAEKKGVRYLLEAMPSVLSDRPDATLVIVGDGPLRGELSLQARDLGISESVRFLGARSPAELPRFYSAADVFVGPSIVAENGDTESFGLVFAEAMSCGCPVVASDVGGISDLVVPGKTGLLVPQRNAQEIAEAIARVLSEPGLRERLRRGGLRHVSGNVAQSVIAQRYRAILQEAAA